MAIEIKNNRVGESRKVPHSIIARSCLTPVIKAILALFITMFANLNVVANEVTIGYLKYSLQGNEATVVGYDETKMPKNLVIPKTIEYNNLTFEVTAIGERVFMNCSVLESIELPNSVKTIRGQAYADKGGTFSNCKNLKKAYLPGIVDINDYAFRMCTNLQYVDMGNQLKTIGRAAFSYCSSLTYLVFPATLSKIVYAPHYDKEDCAFNECNLIQSVIFLGDKDIETGLSNIKKYHPKDFVSWGTSTFLYSGSLPSLNYTNNLPSGFHPISYDSSRMRKDVGTYIQTIPFTFANNDISFDIEIPCTYTINPLTLKAKVNNVSREYGEKNPQFSSTYTGFVNNENESVITNPGNYKTTATTNSNVGSYSIKQSGVTAQNYVFEYEDGTLTVNKAPLTMTANDKTITYGSKLPTLDVKYEGLKNNETTPEWDTEPKITTTATKENDAGTYLINIYNADATNYNITTVSGTLTINKAVLSIKADSKNKLYCESNPQLTCSYVGFVNNETESVLSTKPKLSTTATINSVVGIYPIEVSGANATNYNISYQNAELTIKKRELSVTAHNYTRAYGEENPSFELSYTGFVNNENEDVLLSKPKATTVATTTSDVGVYDITIANGVAENYDFNYNKGKLTIEKAYQTLSWNQDLSEIKKYDQVELTATASSGLEITYTLEGDQICTLTKIGKKQYLDCTGEGEAIIIAIQEGNKNYWQSTKVYKPIVIRSSTGINSVMFDIDDTKIFDISGNQINKLQKGVNILKMSNGETKKVFVK